MSCLSALYNLRHNTTGQNYNPVPPREWTRFENVCTNISAMQYKGNILQYKGNSACLTKNQIYSQMAKGKWVSKTSWATQSVTYSNPNIQSFKRVNYSNITMTGASTTEPITCPTPPLPSTNSALPSNTSIISSSKPPIIPPPVPPSGNTNTVIPSSTPAAVKPTIVIPDGGNLVCSVIENICTGEILETFTTQKCYPTSDSDVPGPIINLCYDERQTYFPRTRRTYLAGSEKWPQGSKFILPI